MNVQELKRTANQVRKNIITAVYYAKAGHPGGSLSSAEIYTYLYMKEMNVDPADPGSPDRDSPLQGTYLPGALRSYGGERIF